MKRFIFVILVSFALIGMAGAQSEWVGPGGTDYNDDGLWNDATAWNNPIPGGIPGAQTAVLEAADFDGVNVTAGTRLITLDMNVDLLALEAPLNIHGNRSGYYTTITLFTEILNKLRMEADMTVGTLDWADTNFQIEMGLLGPALVVNGATKCPKLSSDDATATVLIDGPSVVENALALLGDFHGTLTVGSVANPCLLGGSWWVTMSQDPLDLIPDLPGGNFLNMGDDDTIIIPDGSSVCGRWGSYLSGGPQLSLGGKVILEGEGRDVNGDGDPDGALVYIHEGWNTPDTILWGAAATTTLDLQGDTEIGVMVSPNITMAIVGNTVAPAGAPGATLTKSGVGQLRFDGDVGVDCANTIDIVIDGGRVNLYPTCTLYGNVTINPGGTLIASPSQILCGTVTNAGGTWAKSGVWDGGGDATSYHDPLNWLDDVVPAPADVVSIPGAAVAPIIEVDTALFPAPATTVCDSLVMTAACTLQVDKDMTVQNCDTRSGTLNLVAPATYKIAQVAIEHAYVRAITGDGTLFKTGIAHTFDARNGQHTEAGFTGEIIVDEGLFGPHSWSNGCGGYDSSAYFPNATITIQNDGMATTRATDWATELWGELRLDGNGMGGLLVDAHDGMATLGNGNDWLIKRGAFKRFIEHGNGRVGPYANPVTLLSTSGFICAHTWGWAPGSGQDTELSGLVSGTGTLVKMGDSALILSGTVSNVGSDAVEVRESCLVVNGAITVGDVTVDAPTPYAGSGHHWAWDQSSYDGTTYKQFQPNLGGSGVIHNTLKVLDGGWLFPLKSIPDPTYTVFPSNLTVGDADIDEATWEVGIDALPGAGVAGVNWDFLTSTATGTSGAGALSLALTTFRPKSTMADPAVDTSWQIAVADSAITGAAGCIVLGDDFPNALGSWAVSTANGDTELWLDFTSGGAVEALPGDVTGDCKVNILDMIAVRNHLNEVVDSGNEIYDVTGDGKINILDMILVRNALNTVCGP